MMREIEPKDFATASSVSSYHPNYLHFLKEFAELKKLLKKSV
jgi:hypothetical protein